MAGIIGLMHARMLPEELERKIVEAMKGCKKIALEISQEELEKYKRIWALPEFEREFFVQKNRTFYSKYGVDVTFFTIATIAHKQGIEIVPIDSEELLKRASMFESRLFKLASILGSLRLITYDVEHPFSLIPEEKIEVLRQKEPRVFRLILGYYKTYYNMKYIEEVKREKFMELKIRASNPELIIAGVGHFDYLREALNCRPIYKDKWHINWRETRKELLEIKALIRRLEKRAIETKREPKRKYVRRKRHK